MESTWHVLLPGLPVSSPRGALGWCSVCLVQTAEHNILVDTGSYGDRALLLKRLNERGVRVEDIDHIFLTHFHFDHVLNCDLFPQAVIHLSEVEHRYVTGGEFQRANDPFVPAGFYPLLQERIQLFYGSTDLFPGLQTVPLPGHTPGMTGLLLQQGSVLIAGDGVKNVREFIGVEDPPVFYSLDAARKSHKEAKRIANIIVPGHDNPFRIPFKGPEDYLSITTGEIFWAGSSGEKRHIPFPGK